MDPVLAPGVIGGVIGGACAPFFVVSQVMKSILAGKFSVEEFDVAHAHKNHLAGGQRISKWARSEGMEWESGYRLELKGVGKHTYSVWTDHEGTYAVWGGTGRKANLQIDSRLGPIGSRSLITSDLKDAFQLLNSPLHLMQAFPKHSPAQLSQIHREGVDYLGQQAALMPVPPKGPYSECIAQDLRKQAEYVTSLSFWRFRMVHRFLTHAKNLKKPIAAQSLNWDEFRLPIRVS